MSHKKKNRRGQTGGQGGNGQGKNLIEHLQCSQNPPKCQLSVDSLTRIGYLAGDLGVFLLARLPGVEHLPDPNFYPLYQKALICFDVESELLRRAAQLEQLEAGQ